MPSDTNTTSDIFVTTLNLINNGDITILNDEPDHYFKLGSGYMYQDVDLTAYATEINSGKALMILNTWLKSLSDKANTSYPYLYIYFMQGNTITGRLYSEPKSNIEWIQESLSRYVPLTTNKMRVFLKLSSKKDVADDNDSYFDSIEAFIGSSQ